MQSRINAPFKEVFDGTNEQSQGYFSESYLRRTSWRAKILVKGK